MGLPTCPGCRATVIPKPDDSCPSCGHPNVEKAIAEVPPPQSAPPPPPEPASVSAVEYGGFWIRFGAMWADVLIMLPLMVLQIWVAGYSRTVFVIGSLFSEIVFIYVSVICVKRWGGTPGKLICGLKVVKLDLSPIGWSEAWLRYSINLVFELSSIISQLIAVLKIREAEYLTLSYRARGDRIADLEGSMSTILLCAGQIWIWGELIVLLTNSKRRAIHDFLAGTVIVRAKTLPRG